MSKQQFGFASNSQMGATNQMAAQSSLKTKLNSLEVSHAGSQLFPATGRQQ